MAQLLVIHGQHDQAQAGLPCPAAARRLRRRIGAAPACPRRGGPRALGRDPRASWRRCAPPSRSAPGSWTSSQYSLDEIAELDPQPGEDVALAAEAEPAGQRRRRCWLPRAWPARRSPPRTTVGTARTRWACSPRRAALWRRWPGTTRPWRTRRRRCARSMAQLGEVAADLSRLRWRTSTPIRAGWRPVQERRADLARLTRKYGSSVDEVLAWAAESAAPVAAARRRRRPDRGPARGQLDAAARPSAASCARQLSAGPGPAAAERFAAQVTDELAALAMPRARVAFAPGH